MIAARRVEDEDGTIRVDWAPAEKPASLPMVRDGAIHIVGTVEAFTDCSARALRDALAQWPRGAPIFVELDSTGGSLGEGVAMHLALRCDPRPVTVRIRKQAASAAGLIACAADRIEIGEAATFEIHDTRVTDTKGRTLTAAVLQSLSEACADGDALLRDVLATRCKNSRGWLAEAMHAERKFVGHEAVAVGFADAVIPDTRSPAAFSEVEQG